MKFVTFKNIGEVTVGVYVGVYNKDETGIYPISAAGLKYESMNELIDNITPDEMEKLKKLRESPVGCKPAQCVELLAPIPNPRQDVICLGINYLDHAEEAAEFNSEAFQKPDYPIFFSKRVSEAVPDGGIIPAHADIDGSLDYEAELAVIIGRDCTNVSRDEVKNYIFGYTIINDVTMRSLQTRHKQWYFGKSLDGFTPMGPCIVTADEIAYPPQLNIESYVNGELRQNSNTKLFIFDIDRVVSELSGGMTLKKGTIISTGTPSGVGMGFDPPKFLKKGDMVECTIEGIGTLLNTVG